MTHKEEGNFTQVSKVFNNQEIFPLRRKRAWCTTLHATAVESTT